MKRIPAFLGLTIRDRTLSGVAIWVGYAGLFRPPREEVYLLLSPLVLVPIVLYLAGVSNCNDWYMRVGQVCIAVELPAALLLLASFRFHVGLTSGLISLPWVFTTLCIALYGCCRLLSHRNVAFAELGVDFGLIYLAVGEVWLLLARLGRDPLGAEPLVFFTAVHFHHAGVVLPVGAAMVGRRHPRWAIFLAGGTITGIPLTALGITLGGRWEIFGPSVLAGMAVLLAAGYVRCAVASEIRIQSALLIGAATSLGIGMAYALMWVWSGGLASSSLDLQTMVAIHGTLNAVGFGGLGLLGWAVNPPPSIG